MTTRTLAFALAITAAGFAATSADAALMGTPMNVSITHSGTPWSMLVGGPAALPHTYGGLPSLFNNPFLGSFVLASPTAAPGFDNAILVDFSLFNYSGFIADTGTISITGLSENVAPGSVSVFAGAIGAGLNIASGVSSATDSFSASWFAGSIFTPDATPDAMVVAWNSAVPAPGAMALLGVAGLITASRRRRA